MRILPRDLWQFAVAPPAHHSGCLQHLRHLVGLAVNSTLPSALGILVGDALQTWERICSLAVLFLVARRRCADSMPWARCLCVSTMPEAR